MPDIRHAGLRILGHHDAGRDVGAAVLRAVLRNREIADVDVVACDDLLLARRAVGSERRRDRVVEPVQDLVEDRFVIRLECQQRLLACRIDAGDQRIVGAVVIEHDRRPVAHVALLHGLADIVQCDRPVDVDQFAMLAQHVEKLTEVLERHCVILQR